MKMEQVAFPTVMLAIIALVGAASFAGISSISSRTASGPSYTINGLTCSVPQAYLRYTSVIHLLPLVTATSGFQSLANEMPFVFGNAENLTNGIQQIGNNPPVHLPDALEMVFYSAGQKTTCGTFLNRAQVIIDVQVPIQNGGYNLTGATYDTLTPSGGPRNSTAG